MSDGPKRSKSEISPNSVQVVAGAFLLFGVVQAVVAGQRQHGARECHRVHAMLPGPRQPMLAMQSSTSA